MEEKRDGHAIVSNVIKSLESGDSFSPSDREKFAQTAREHGIEGSVIEFAQTAREHGIEGSVIEFAQTAREHGIEGSVIEEVIDIAQTILPREEKKAVRAELQKSIDENLEALRKIINI